MSNSKLQRLRFSPKLASKKLMLSNHSKFKSIRFLRFLSKSLRFPCSRLRFLRQNLIFHPKSLYLHL